jgi:hypothetical protein
MVQPVAVGGVISVQSLPLQANVPDAVVTAAVVPAPMSLQFVSADVAVRGLLVEELPAASAGSSIPTVPTSSPWAAYQIMPSRSATM